MAPALLAMLLVVLCLVLHFRLISRWSRGKAPINYASCALRIAASKVTRLQSRTRKRHCPTSATTMAGLWRSRVLVFLVGLLSSSLVSAEHSFENTAIVRTVELGGSLVHVTTTYAVRALEDGSSIYTIALGEDEHKKTSWIQAKMKGETVPLRLEDFGLNHHSYVSC